MGVVKLEDALKAALAAGLDLVEISPQAEPPVCKMMDFGRYKYEGKKRLQEARKKSKVVHIKEVKFRPNIGQGDFDVKVRNIKKFIEDGDKVRASLWFRGREIVHNEIGQALMQKVVAATEEIAKIELEPRLEGKQMLMILVPRG